MKWLIALAPFVAQALTPPLDACRLRSRKATVHCQHFRQGGKTERIRSLKTIDGWVAVPCKQLKRHIPEIDCSKRMGFTRLGEE